MPELAEVEYNRKQWDAGIGQRLTRVHLHAHARNFRGIDDPEALRTALAGALLRSSRAHGKQMLFGLSGGKWLGLHLGMAGKLFAATAGHVPHPHDHFVLYTKKTALVFRDYRQFGRLRYDEGKAAPDWWQALPPGVLDEGFTVELVRETLARRKRSPLKAVLLLQEVFPGIGNWMADEILWRTRLHPALPAGKVSARKARELHGAVRELSRQAMETIGVDYRDPPEDWLMPHRWRDGGTCPATGKPLERATIGGRTTCWSPARQKLPQGA